MADDARTSTIITKCNGKDKVIDFRDRLQVAQTRNYATMHQGGGRSPEGEAQSYPSVIHVTVCDFTKGTGDKSVTVAANIDPTMPYEWLEVCKQSLGSATIPMKKRQKKAGGKEWETELVNNEINGIVHNIAATTHVARLVVSTLTNRLAKIMRGELAEGSKDDQTLLGGMLKTARGRFSAEEDLKFLTMNQGIDYSFTQDKVNVYRKGNDGYAPVTRLTVNRTSYRNDGDASGYPWYIKIVTGEAVVVEKDTGATTFDGKTLRNQKEAFIVVSDRDMFRMCQRMVRFIETWENAMCIPLILAGEKQRQAEREQY